MWWLAELDDCGECNGLGADYECWDGSVVCYSSECPEDGESMVVMMVVKTVIQMYVYILMVVPLVIQVVLKLLDSNLPIMAVTGAAGGDAAANGFTVSAVDTVLDFHLQVR